jgi:hypothetical protein
MFQLLKWFGNSPRSNRSRRAASKKARPLQLEALEDRLTPTIFFTPQLGPETLSNGGNHLGQTSPGMPIYAIYMGSYWQTPAGSQQFSQIENSINGIFFNTACLDGLHQYGPNQRAFEPGNSPFVFNTSDPAKWGRGDLTVSDDDIRGVVENAIDNQGLPEADDFSNAGVYLVFTPPGVTSSTYTNAGGYHDQDSDYDFPFDFDSIDYGWIGNDGTLNTVTDTMSHEVAEAMTDPNPGSGVVVTNTSPNSELGDNEAQNYNAFLGGFLIQSYWSAADQSYIVSDGNTQSVTVNNGQLTVNGDQLGASFNDSITIDQNSAGGVLVTLNGESFSLSPGEVSSIVVNTGGGSNTVNVRSTLFGVPVNINGGGSDAVNVGHDGTVQDINGTVNIENTPSFTRITIDDSADSTARTVTLSTLGTNPADSQGNADVWGRVSGLAPANINYEYGDTSRLTLNTGWASGTTVNVQATDSIATTNLVSHGSTTVNLGLGGSVQGIAGTLNIENPPSYNTINIDDSADSTARTVTLSTLGTNSADSQGNTDVWGQVSGLAPASINYEYGDTSRLTLNTGWASGTTVNVRATDSIATTNLVGHGSTTVTVGNAGSVQGIAGTLNIENPPSFTTITLDDSADATGRTVTLSTLGTNPNDSEHNTDSWGRVTGLAPGVINYEYGDTRSLTINGGSGGNSFVVSATHAVSVTLNGGSGTNTLTGPNVSTTWIINAANAGTLSNVTFNHIANLVGGTGVDVFQLAAAGKVASIRGGGAPAGQGDWLDYSSFTTPVTVNLATGSATNVNSGAGGAVSGIQDVHGGNGGNTLTGNSLGNILIGGSGSNTITGGSGRSLLIGDAGPSTITGGSGGTATGGDILIAGTTTFDSVTNAHLNALMAILAEWQSADSYATRFSKINTGTGMPPGDRLTWGSTVLDNNKVNTLKGQAGAGVTDWFFANTAFGHSKLLNWRTGEHINNI